ncbi:3'-5' exoribonuclease YhaM family protein [Pseudothermotoga sp.]|nr:HD domain-containing protein [Pseudothermotoga sp.]MCX7812243.1 HD domain-containing protein [Pseudothermotoga sp.]MDW8139313.1 OB-fold nucleic acid binding domain-containing protein [Pseudothermotoga sp.]
MKLEDLLPKDVIDKLRERTKSTNPYIQELSEKTKENVELIGRIVSKKLQESKDGKKFLLMTLSDRTGSIRAVDWYNAEENDMRFAEGDVILAKGRVVFFEGHLQLNIEKDKDALIPLSEDQYDYERFVEITKRNIESLYQKLIEFIRDVQDREIRSLIETLLVHDKEFVSAFIQAPAGVSVHHAYMGGLLEHTVDVTTMCKRICSVYDFLNRDILIAGAILHDIGKVKEYKITKKGLEVTTEGELKGHIALGLEVLQQTASKINIAKMKLLQLEHIVLSHHGEYEFGSPVLPKTVEAYVVHALENMDSKLSRFRVINEKQKNGDKMWSDFDKHLGRRVWLGRWKDED